MENFANHHVIINDKQKAEPVKLLPKFDDAELTLRNWTFFIWSAIEQALFFLVVNAEGGGGGGGAGGAFEVTTARTLKNK